MKRRLEMKIKTKIENADASPSFYLSNSAPWDVGIGIIE